MHEKDIDEIIKVNIQAPILLTKYLCRSMLLNQNGRIINISSIIGSTGFNGLVFMASKSSMSGFKNLFQRIRKSRHNCKFVSSWIYGNKYDKRFDWQQTCINH